MLTSITRIRMTGNLTVMMKCTLKTGKTMNGLKKIGKSMKVKISKSTKTKSSSMVRTGKKNTLNLNGKQRNSDLRRWTRDTVEEKEDNLKEEREVAVMDVICKLASVSTARLLVDLTDLSVTRFLVASFLNSMLCSTCKLLKFTTLNNKHKLKLPLLMTTLSSVTKMRCLLTTNLQWVT